MKKITNFFNEFLASRNIKIVLCIVGGIIIALLIFQAGIFVGTRKATFAMQWGDNYHRNFGGPPGGFLHDFRGEDFMGGHGVAGSIISIDQNTLVIKGSDNRERIVVVDNATVIRKGMTTITLSDLKVDDTLVVLGTPNEDGTIQAKMVRLFSPEDHLPMFPPPPMFKPGDRLPMIPPAFNSGSLIPPFLK